MENTQTLPLVISLAALAFTVFSFWWMNWRPGRLSVGNVAQFAAGMATEGRSDKPNVVLITLPLVMHNSGARPVVVESMRLVGTTTTTVGTLHYEAVDSHLPSPNLDVKYERNHFYLPVALKANEVIKENFVFEQRNTSFSWGQLLYHFHLEAKISGSRDWVKLKDIELDFRDSERTPSLVLNIGYCAYPSGANNAV